MMDPLEAPEPEQFSRRPTLTPMDDGLFDDDLCSESWDLSEDFFTLPPSPVRNEDVDEEDLFVVHRRSWRPLWIVLGCVALGIVALRWISSPSRPAEAALAVAAPIVEIPPDDVIPQQKPKPTVAKKRTRHKRKRVRRSGNRKRTAHPADPKPRQQQTAHEIQPPAQKISSDSGKRVVPIMTDRAKDKAAPLSVSELPTPLALGALAPGTAL